MIKQGKTGGKTGGQSPFSAQRMAVNRRLSAFPTPVADALTESRLRLRLGLMMRSSYRPLTRVGSYVAGMCTFWVGWVLFGTFSIWVFPRAQQYVLAKANGNGIAWQILDASLAVGGPFLLPSLAAFLAGLTVYSVCRKPHRELSGQTRCRECGYILKGLLSPRCPECGEPI